MMDVTTYAVRALMRTLRDRLPARLAALDADRRAQLVCAPGPYKFAAAAELVLNGEEVTIPGGTYAASELADLLGFSSLEVGEVGGRLVVTAPVATEAEASQIQVGAAAANEVLGIHEALDDQVLLALASPSPIFLARSLMATDIDVTRPVVAIDREGTRPGSPYTTGERLVTVRLEVLYPGPVGARGETLEAIHALAAAIMQTVADGDERGPYLVGDIAWGERVSVCRPVSLQVEPTVRTFGRGTNTHPIGRAMPEFEIQVWDLD